MAFNEKLVSYVNDGVARGFSFSHIADVLRKHGYRETEIAEAFSRVTPRKQGRSFAVIGAGLALFALLVVALALPSESPTAAITGNVVGTQDDAHVFLNRIAQLQDETDKQQAEIDQALEDARKAELSASERERLLVDLQSYYDQVKREREETRSALFELWTFLFSKKAIG